MKISEAIIELTKALEKYQDKQTEDGPYIQIWPTKIEVIDCYGQSMLEKDADAEEAADALDVLN